MCSPTDVGVKSKSFRLNDLSEILMNGKKATPPCPCGFRGHPSIECHCSQDKVRLYRSRISGPLLDRIDLHVEVPALESASLASGSRGEASRAVRARVARARTRQLERQGRPNARLPDGELEAHCRIDEAARHALRRAGERMLLSARGHHRVLKVARTIADLEACARVGEVHVSEALIYRAT